MIDSISECALKGQRSTLAIEHDFPGAPFGLAFPRPRTALLALGAGWLHRRASALP